VGDLVGPHTLPEYGAHGGTDAVLGRTSPTALLGGCSEPILDLLTDNLLGPPWTKHWQHLIQALGEAFGILEILVGVELESVGDQL